MSRSPTERRGNAPAPVDLLDRMVRSVRRVGERLRRATSALEEAGIPYAVIGEQAVACWVRRADPSAERYSPAAEILLNRSDLMAAGSALARAGFERHGAEGDLRFHDGPRRNERDAVRVGFAAEKARPGDLCAAPEIRESEGGDGFRVIALEPLVSMKLTPFRLIDKVNLRDMIDVALVDESWLRRLPAPLSARLKELLDSPDG